MPCRICHQRILIPNRFMDGGITAISILLHEIFHIHICYLAIILNLWSVYLGYKRIGKTFAVQTSIAVILFSIGLLFIDINLTTNDKFLIAAPVGI